MHICYHQTAVHLVAGCQTVAIAVLFHFQGPHLSEADNALTAIKQGWQHSHELDIDVHAGREVQRHELFHGLGAEVLEVHQPEVGPPFELLPAVLVDVR